jgi:hypothetical protein
MAGGLFYETVEDVVNDVFEVSKKTIDHIPRRRSIEATAKPDNRVLKPSFGRPITGNIFVVAVEEVFHYLGGSCSRIRPISAGANTSNLSRNSKERWSNNASVSVSTTLKNNFTEGSFCRVAELILPQPLLCSLVW